MLKGNGINDKFGVKTPDTQEAATSDDIKILESVGSKKSKQTWAKLIRKVYEIDPLICPKCQSEMKVIAVITDYDDIQKILACLKKNKSPPFDKQDNTQKIAA